MKRIKVILLSGIVATYLVSNSLNLITPSVLASASEWSSVGATLTDVKDGVEISNLTWGCRAHSVNKLTLDGLEFDFEFTNVDSDSSVGFYFGTEHLYYSPQTGISDNTITFTLNSSASFYAISQNRFGTFHTHDINDSNGPQTYTDTSLSKPDGFGYHDGTAVMNKHDSQKLHFAFSKIDTTWYKMTMKDLIGKTFWEIEDQKPVDNTLTIYMKANQLKLDEFGRAYLFGFGFNGSTGQTPIIRFTNYQGDVTAPVINIKNDKIVTYAGLCPDESFEAIDDKDGIVPISYKYPSGAIDEDGKLLEGEFTVTLTAKDSANNVSNKTIKYLVLPEIDKKVAHRINVESSGTNVVLQKTSYFEGENVWFTCQDEGTDRNVEVIESDGNVVSLKGNNPYYFKMPNKNVTIVASATTDYFEINNLHAYDEKFVSYLGRYYKKNNGIYFANSNAGFGLCTKVVEQTNSIKVTFDASASFSTETKQYAQLFVDGNRYGDRIVIENGSNTVVTIAENLNIGEHIIEFKKCNETQYSSLIIKNIIFDNVKVKEYVDDRPIIEFFGDSISCGYGNLSTGTGFSLSTEDSTQAYTNLTADALNYRSSSIAYSGIGLYHSWTDSPITAMTLYKQIDGQEYNMRKDNVKISVINLGTNDNVKYNSLEESKKPDFVNGMKKNIKAMMNTILDTHPGSSIIVAYEMMTAISNDIINAYKTAIEEVKLMWDTSKIFSIQFDRNEQGVDGHPNLIGHQNAANKLVNFIVENNLN